MARIRYAVDPATGLVWSKVGDEVAVPIPETWDTLCQRYVNLEIRNVHAALPGLGLKWTYKIPLSEKNRHRKLWGKKELKSRPKSSPPAAPKYQLEIRMED